MKLLPLTLITLAFLATPACAQNPLTLVGHYEAENYGDHFGAGMTTGDFDNDSYKEFIIGAFGWNNNTGKNYIYPGGPEFPTEPAWLIHGQQENEGYDVSTQNVGDVSGDGIDDFAIATHTVGTIIDTACLDIYFGSEPIDTIPDWTFCSPFHNLPNNWDVDSCGDVNGDGGKDLLVKLRGATVDTLLIYIFWGGTILDTIPDWTNFSISVNLQVDGLGDVNGDGYSDILLLGYNNDEYSQIFFGGSPMDTIPDLVFDHRRVGAGVRDFNADGYNDVFFERFNPDSIEYYALVYFGGADMDTVPDVRLKEWDGEYSGAAVVSCGDFNGDGYGDIISMTGYGFYLDAVQIHLGSPNANPTPDAYLTGSPLDGWGEFLNAGDVNGDGRDELLVCEMDPIWYTGEVYLYEGPEEWIDYGAGVDPEDIRHHPGWFTLDQNYPNPFNASTSIHFEIGKPSTVNLTIYDLQGNRIKNLITSKDMLPGGYNVSWTGRNENNQPVSSGIYLLDLRVDQYRQIRKMVLLR